MLARIYKPSKTSMQAGHAKTERWVLDFAPSAPQETDPLMGWTGSRDTLGNQVRMTFATKEAAVAYAKAQKLPFQVIDPPAQKPVYRNYAENFSHRRRNPWTH